MTDLRDKKAQTVGRSILARQQLDKSCVISISMKRFTLLCEGVTESTAEGIHPVDGSDEEVLAN